MSAESRRFHHRYQRPSTGAILETVDAVRFRVDLEELSVLSPYFESFLSSRARKPIRLGLVSSEVLVFALDLLTGSLGSGRAPKVPPLTEEFLEELTSLTFIYQLAGPLQYVAREVAGPRPHLGRAKEPVKAYVLVSLYQRWVALNSGHLAKQLEKPEACRTAFLGLRFTEADIGDWEERVLQEYHPTALHAMRAALSRRRELEYRLDAIDALPLLEACGVCAGTAPGLDTAPAGGEEEEDEHVQPPTEDEFLLRRRQAILGPRLAKLEKVRDVAQVAHLGYCVLQCRACRRVVRDMLLRQWTYGSLEEWRDEWHFGSEFKFPPSDLEPHNCAGLPCTPPTSPPPARPACISPSKTITPDDHSDHSSGTPRPSSAGSSDTAKLAPGKDGIRDDAYDAYAAALSNSPFPVPPTTLPSSLCTPATDEDRTSVRSHRSARSARSLPASLASATSSDGPFRYDDVADTSDSGSSYGHLPDLDEVDEEDAKDGSCDYTGDGCGGDRYAGDGYGAEAYAAEGYGDGFGMAPSPSGTLRVLPSPTNILGVITETEEEYESSRDSFVSQRGLSPNPLGAYLEREDEASDAEGSERETPAIVITVAEGEGADTKGGRTPCYNYR